MKTSFDGIMSIRRHERLMTKAYRCPAGVWTIGYGHTKGIYNDPHGVHEGDEIDSVTAENLLKYDLDRFEKGVLQHTKVRLSQNEFDAMVSFAFNIGVEGHRKSTVLRAINEGRKRDVPAQLMLYVNGRNPKTGKKEPLNGLIARRRYEAGIWRKLEPIKPNDIDTAVVPEEPELRKPWAQSKTILAAAASTGAGGIAAVNETVRVARDTADNATGLASLFVSVPGIIMVVIIIAAGSFIIRERYKKLEEGV